MVASGALCPDGSDLIIAMRTSDAPADLQMSLFTFTHDHYLLQLPPHHHKAFYNAFPLYLRPDFKGQPLQFAPVLRLYGTNKQARKCCCHVHGYFPSLYIKAGPFQQAFADPVQLLAFLLSLQAAFAKAHRSENRQLLFRAELQQKFDFYGYHTRKEGFLRLELINPQDVGKLRELLSSAAVGGRPFQCYEAHINYHMQFFADLNVYGSNQMRICGYTIRKHPLPDLFQKIQLRSRPQTDPPINPECYNTLHKTSGCEVEIDFDYRSILNAYQTVDSSQEEISSSDEDVLAGTLQKRKLKVTVTKALQEIWRDEKKRRNRFKINRPLEALIDLTKNVESTQAVQQGLKDPLWVNFLNKGDNAVQFINMVRSYSSAPPLPKLQNTRVDVAICQQYREEAERKKEQLVQKVHSRWRYYAQRKDRIIGELMSGERAELPEWEDDKSSSDSEDSQDSQNSQVSQIETISQKKAEVGNTVKYRNNFKFQMGSFKTGSIFSDCRFCRKKVYHCECSFCPNCKNEDCNCPIPIQEDKTFKWKEVELQWGINPPSIKEVLSSTKQQYQKPYYSKMEDLFQHYKLPNSLPMTLKIGQYLERQLRNTAFFNRQPPSINNSEKLPYFYTLYHSSRFVPLKPTTYQLEYQQIPPSSAQAMQFLSKKGDKATIRPSSTANVEDTFVADILIFSYELLIQVTSPLYCGDPEKHSIYAIIYEIYNQQAPAEIGRGIIIREKDVAGGGQWDGFGEVWTVSDERAILSLLINLVFRVDPDILMTWDMERRGIRYLAQRGIVHGINIANCLSRACDMEELFEHINFIEYKVLRQTNLSVKLLQMGNIQELARKQPSPAHDYYLSILQEKLKQRLTKRPVLRKNYYFDLAVKGRLNLNLSRTCQTELKLRSYSLPSVVSYLFSTQLPQLTDATLWAGWSPDGLASVSKRLEYVRLVVRELNVVGGVIEKSKIFGADFPSMMERGSQFKIESVLCRTTKQNDYLTLSATKEQVANQAILECRPFVMEPPKQFYSDPVLLFDFQSLYPSVMIAYNLCYSTCLGNLKQLFQPGRIKRLGVTGEAGLHLEQLVELLGLEGDQQALGKALSHYVFVSPNRVAFVRKNLREGFIPRILLEFLLSRIMIKDSSKLYHRQSVKKALGQRQLALKMFMNVMFGYTGASFTGRMPCSEIADAVVEVSKYCLRQAIDHLNSHPRYKGHVLYGDTDSIFFHVPGLPLSAAFPAGLELAAQITKLFPYPMQMKFEKVYESLFLVSKKRYYGKSYQSAQSAPKYEGKGLETVRRDGIPFTTDVMDKLLRLAIDSKDLSAVKELLLKQSRRLLQGEVAAYSLSLAKQVKLLKYNSKSMPAHGQAAKRLQSIDRMLAPRYGQRCKYVIVHGGETVRGRAIPLFEYMLHPERFKLDLKYYYEKQFLPPLRRVLISLANIDEWGLQHQYSRDRLKIDGSSLQCSHPAKKGQLICSPCLNQELQQFETAKESAERVCRQCTGCNFEECIEWDCRNLYVRKRAKEEWAYARGRGKELMAIKELMDC